MPYRRGSYPFQPSFLNLGAATPIKREPFFFFFFEMAPKGEKKKSSRLIYYW